MICYIVLYSTLLYYTMLYCVLCGMVLCYVYGVVLCGMVLCYVVWCRREQSTNSNIRITYLLVQQHQQQQSLEQHLKIHQPLLNRGYSQQQEQLLLQCWLAD